MTKKYPDLDPDVEITEIPIPPALKHAGSIVSTSPPP